VGFVMAHHAVGGMLAPERVYNHGAAEANPELFAALDGTFILAESIACLIFWKVNEEALDAEHARRAELEEANGALTKANEEISDLVAMLSHDLRTPLAVVNGFAEMAIDSWSELGDDERLAFMRRVESSGRQLEQMVDDTLTVSALSAEGLQPRSTPVRVDEEVRALLVALQEPLHGVDLSGLAPACALGDAKGTGLGLFIARSLVTANGGDVAFSRPSGGGAAFSVVLPAARLVGYGQAVGAPQVTLANG
jgi:signal transduction histidine kinase